MKILLISDTHGYFDDAMRNHCHWADEVWHAGDIGSIEVVEKIQAIKPLRAVYGNIDGKELRAIFPLDEKFAIDNLKVFMTHIGGYPNHYESRILKQFESFSPNLFICGHSHILKVMADKSYNLLMMNPGAAGKQGFHKMRTLIRFEIIKSEIKKPEVIELGLRGI